MAWRLIRPVIMVPKVRPDADGVQVIKQAVEVMATSGRASCDQVYCANSDVPYARIQSLWVDCAVP